MEHVQIPRCLEGDVWSLKCLDATKVIKWQVYSTVLGMIGATIKYLQLCASVFQLVSKVFRLRTLLRLRNPEGCGIGLKWLQLANIIPGFSKIYTPIEDNDNPLILSYIINVLVSKLVSVPQLHLENLDACASWPIYFVQTMLFALSLAHEKFDVLTWNSVR